jgi:Mn-dependent DtxR family transcriptional regulator
LKRVKITHNLVLKLVESKEILTFSYFIKLKYLHTNSTVYNYSIRKLANLIDVAPNSIKKHLKKMEEMGIVNIVKNKAGGKNITFLSLEKVSKKYRVFHNRKCGSFYFKKSESIQDIKTKLYSRVLINNINRQKNTIKGKSNSIMRKRDQLKKLTKAGSSGLEVLERSIASERINFDTFICCETIGKMFDKTKMTGYNQLKKMATMGLVSIRKKYMTVLENCTREEYERLSEYGQFIKGKYYYSYKDASILKNVGFSVNVL